METHLGLLIPSTILTFIRVVGIGISISLHGVNAIIKDLLNKNTLKQHMIDFKFKFGFYYIEFKNKIEKGYYF